MQLARLIPSTIAAAGLLLAAPGAALANGNNSHLGITLDARAHLPEGELRTLLERPDMQQALGNGAAFPDGGYAVGDDYGEMAHWEPFVVAYMEWIREHFRKPYSADPEAAIHVAFLMGIASHGMADQVYDSLFMAVARPYETGWSDEFLQDFDTATDVFYVLATGIDVVVEPWAPSYELEDLYASKLDYEIFGQTIDTAMRLLDTARAYPRMVVMDEAKLAAYAANYPYAFEHEMDARIAGTPPCENVIVSAYMQVIWDRLNGEDSLENLVIATTPSPGAGGVDLDHTKAESQVGIAFGHALDDSTIHDSSIVVKDAAGAVYPVDWNMWRSESNVMRLRPKADWPADTLMTVTLAAGIRSIDGLELDAPWSFQFRTGPAADDAPLPGAVDPTPNSGPPDTSGPDAGPPTQPDAGPPAPEDDDGGGCGCSVGGAHTSTGATGAAILAALVAFAALAVSRRARPASRRSRSRRSSR